MQTKKFLKINPRKGRTRRTARAAKPPPLSGRSVSERGWRRDSGDSDCPHLFSQPSSACQPHRLPRAASGGTGRNICVLEERASASWKPLQSLPGLRGGVALSSTQVGALPSPCRFWELGRQREAWSQSWLLPHLPAPAHPSGQSLHIILKESLFRRLIFLVSENP